MRRYWVIVLVAGVLLALGLVVAGPWAARGLGPAGTMPAATGEHGGDLNVLRVMTANVRYADPKDKENVWPNRRELLMKTVLGHEPDLVGFQEVTPAQGLFLQREMKAYGFVSSVEGEDVATAMLNGLDMLAYRKGRFEVVGKAAGLIRPEVIQPVATENAFYTLVVLKDTKKVLPEIVFLNTHVRHDEANAVACMVRVRAILAEQLKAHPGAAVVVTGDMNHDKNDASVAALLDKKTAGPELVDTFDYGAKKAGEKWGTYHAFTGKAGADMPTDLIFAAGLKAGGAAILRDHTEEGRYPSDHFFVEVELRVK